MLRYNRGLVRTSQLKVYWRIGLSGFALPLIRNGYVHKLKTLLLIAVQTKEADQIFSSLHRMIYVRFRTKE